jgi:MoaA/NifB/PqqE/SkfB family radical SAM enzyme
MIEFLRLGVNFAILRRELPFILGLAITDICNLSCRHCRVSNHRHEMMSYDEVRAHLDSSWRGGARAVYFEGGEPYLWRDRQQRLPELVALARELGYLSVHVYTNGTFPITAPADFTWVSIDGPDEINLALRGVTAETVIANTAACSSRCGIVFTVNTVNRHSIEPFLRLVQARLPGLRVMFFFHTPYYGIDELFLSPEQRSEAICTIAACKRAGLPVMNSKAGLKAMQTGRYPHPTNLSRVVDRGGDYQCCRAVDQPGVCLHCGYSSCAEIMLARDFRPGPFRSILQTW